MNLDGIEYSFTQANFIKTKNNAFKLLGILDGCFKGTDIDIGKVLSNIGTDKTREVEEFVLSTLTAKDENGKVIELHQNNEFNAHFNKYRKHYFNVLIEGVKFHFLDFLPNGIASRVNIDNLGVTAE